jgi:hypothetical protein
MKRIGYVLILAAVGAFLLGCASSSAPSGAGTQATAADRGEQEQWRTRLIEAEQYYADYMENPAPYYLIYSNVDRGEPDASAVLLLATKNTKCTKRKTTTMDTKGGKKRSDKNLCAPCG